MSKVIGIRISDEHYDLLVAYQKEQGFNSPARAGKYLLEKCLTETEEYAHLEPLFRRIEERVAQVGSRGTKAAIASLCLQSAKDDEAMNSKFASMPAGAVFDYAWDMAGALMTHGQRPNFYKAAKTAGLVQARQNADELVDYAESLDSLAVLIRLDESDIALWFENMKVYRELRDAVTDNPSSVGEEWLSAYASYAQAQKNLLSILCRMEIQNLDDFSAFATPNNFFDYINGWHIGQKEERIERQQRLVCKYTNVLDTLDQNYFLYDFDDDITCWEDVLKNRGVANAD